MYLKLYCLRPLFRQFFFSPDRFHPIVHSFIRAIGDSRVESVHDYEQYNLAMSSHSSVESTDSFTCELFSLGFGSGVHRIRSQTVRIHQQWADKVSEFPAALLLLEFDNRLCPTINKKRNLIAA